MIDLNTGSTEKLVRALHAAVGGDLGAICDRVAHHNVSSRAKKGLAGGSTGKVDCAFLYLLTAAFRRKLVFEIGTYVGSSALAMHLGVERGGGGQVVTCDPDDFDCLPAGIRFIHEPDDQAIVRLADEGAVIDFVFADWIPSDETLRRLNEIGDRQLIFSAHDYYPGDKGETAVNTFSERYERIGAGRWFLPEAHPIEVEPGILVEKATAVFIPTELLLSLGGGSDW